MGNNSTTYSALAWRYGVTNAFTTLLTTVASTYWAIFLTGAVGMEKAVMASILSIASLCDLISLPIVGVVMQKVRLFGGKYGVFRPWLIIAGVLAAIFRALSFTNIGLTGAAQGFYFGAMYVLCYVCFNFAYSAFTGLLPLMAGRNRVAFASARVTCNSAGKFIFSLTSVSLVAILGGGDDAKGYSLLAILIAVLVIVGFIQLFYGAKEYDLPTKAEASTGTKAADQYNASFFEMLRFTITKPFVLYLIGATCKGSIYMTITGLSAYYYNYVVGDRSMLTVYMSASTFLMIGASFFTPYCSKIFKGSRNTYVAGIIIYGGCLAAAYFAGANATVFTFFLAIGYVGYAVAHSAEAALYSSIVDYTQWKHNRDLKPFMMTLFSLTPKIGTTVGSMIIGWGLVAIGFDEANITEGAVAGIRMLICGIPAILAFVCAVCLFLCPMSDAQIKQIEEDLAARKA